MLIVQNKIYKLTHVYSIHIYINLNNSVGNSALYLKKSRFSDTEILFGGSTSSVSVLQKNSRVPTTVFTAAKIVVRQQTTQIRSLLLSNNF